MIDLKSHVNKGRADDVDVLTNRMNILHKSAREHGDLVSV